MRKLALGTVIGCLALLVIGAMDISNKVIRYRNGSSITFDAQSTIADEDGAWTITAAQLKTVASGITTNFSVLLGNSTTNTLYFTNGILLRVTAP